MPWARNGFGSANRARGPADDELSAGQGDRLGGRLASFDHAEKLGQNALGSLVQVDADRGQRHHLELGLGNIVKPDDRYVAGDLPAGLVEGPKDSHGHLVVGGENCRDIVPGCEPAPLFVP